MQEMKGYRPIAGGLLPIPLLLIAANPLLPLAAVNVP